MHGNAPILKTIVIKKCQCRLKLLRVDFDQISTTRTEYERLLICPPEKRQTANFAAELGKAR